MINARLSIPVGLALALSVSVPVRLAAQDAHQHAATPSWTWMADGVAFLTYNHQGTERGETQFRSQNWLMGMGTRTAGRGTLTLMGMFSLDPVTVTKRGYSQLFQMGEAYNGLENTDRQHPHDLISQLAASYRLPLGGSAALTFSGGPIGEATLGPVAFMHRKSASENPTAPLSHHTLDSSHISQGVVAAGLDVGPWTIEGSAFHGREPDEDRYGITVGRLDSWASRLWFRSGGLSAQVSHALLNEPEQLARGDVRRTTASFSWSRERATSGWALTTSGGRNKRTYSESNAFLVEATGRYGKTFTYGRVELLQIETEHLLFPSVVHTPHPGELIDRLNAYTAGIVRDVVTTKAFTLGLGGDVTLYTVPARLEPYYGDRPVSFHIFGRIRPSGGPFMRMWNMTMTAPARHGM